MARSIYGASGAAQVVSPTGIPMVAAATVKSARTGGSTVTDVTNMAGTGLGGIVTPDARGQIIFQGPDGSTATYWLDFGDGGARWGVTPVDVAGLFSAAATARELAQYTTPDGTTAHAALPYKANSISQALATVLDSLVIKRFASAAARDTAFPSPTDGDRVYRTDLHCQQTYRALGTPRWVTDNALIQEQILSVDSAAVTFNSIPQEWRNLNLVYRTRTTGSPSTQTVTSEVVARFNNDSSNSYDSIGRINRVKHASGAWTYEVAGDGSGGVSSGTTGATYATLNNVSGVGGSTMHIGICTGSGLVTLHAGGDIQIKDYTNSTTRKPFVGYSGFGDAAGGVGTGYLTHAILQGGWNSIAPITRMDVLPGTSGSFVAGSYFALYGQS